VIFAIFAVFASGVEEEMWGPDDTVKAFDVIETALKKVTSMKMSPDMSKKAHKVADDVRSTMTAIESNKNMTKVQKNEKVAEAMKELQSLAMDLQKSNEALEKQHEKDDLANEHQKEEHLKELKVELEAKKKELLKDEAMIKLYKLKKELAEKKLQIQKLIEKKNKANAAKESGAEEAKAEGALVSKLMKLKDSVPTDKKAELPGPLKSALEEVKAFSKKESDKLATMEKENKQTMAALDAEMQKEKNVPTQGKDDVLAKAPQMMRRLKKEEHRMFLKAQALKKKQLTELKAVEQSIEQHDAKKLNDALLKMQHDAKAAAAKSGDFLH